MSTADQPPGQNARFEPRPQQELIQLRRHAISLIETYDVTEQELRNIEMESTDLGQDFQFGTNALAIAVSFFIALALTRIESPKVYACFFAVVLTMAVFATYFGIRWWRKKATLQSTIRIIRDRQVGPVGEQGHEIPQSELEQLPSEPEHPEEAADEQQGPES